MPQQIEFEGVTHEFPDDFTQADIGKALAKSPKPKSPSASLPRSLGTILTPPLQESGFFSENGFGPGTFAKGIGEVIQPGTRMKGAHDMFIGAGEIGSPLILPAFAAAPALTAGTLAAGAAGGAAGKYGSEALGASPEVSDLIGDVGTVIGGGLVQSPKVRAFSRGAAQAVPGALSDQGPLSLYSLLRGKASLPASIGAFLGHLVGHPYEGAAAGATLGAAPSVIRGGMAAAENAPWIPRAPIVRSPPGWQEAGTTASTGPVPGSRVGQNPFAEALDPPQLESGRQAGGSHNVPLSPPPIPAREAPLWKQYGAEAHARPVPGPVESIQWKETPSGRKPGGIQNQTPLETVSAPPVDDVPSVEQIARSLGAKGKLSPADIQAAKNIQDNLRGTASKVSVPPMASPLESKVIAPEVPSGTATPGRFEATLKGHQAAKAQKIQNIHDFLTTAKHEYTPEKLIEMDAASPGKLSPAKQKFLKDAYEWAKSQGRPVPKSGYTSLNLQETRPGYEGQGTLQDVLDLMGGKDINPMHMPLKDPFGWGK